MTQQISANLSLPYIQPSQAQKHVTHNEAIRLLDALVQAVVEEPPRDTPPASAPEGARYLIGAAPSDAWAGHPNAIAWRTDGAWSFLAPQPGWAVRVVSDGSTRVWRSGSWQTDGLPEVVTQLGFNTSADTTNRLAVASDATLLSHDGDSHQLKINKASATDTASVVFQVGFQGRAEMGLTGTNSYEIKVLGADTNWLTGLRVDQLTGLVSFPNGVAVPGRVDLGGQWTCTDGQWTGPNAIDGSYDAPAGTGTAPDLGYTDLGPLIPAGATLTTLTGAFRSGDAEITGFDLRVYFQTGAWDGTWDSNAETTRTLLYSADNQTLGTAWARINGELGNWVAPDDGMLVVFLRPTGTLTAPRAIYSTIRVGYITAS